MCFCICVYSIYIHKHVCEHAHMYSHRDQRKVLRILLHNSSFSSASGVANVWVLHVSKLINKPLHHISTAVKSLSSVSFNPCWILHSSLVVNKPQILPFSFPRQWGCWHARSHTQTFKIASESTTSGTSN